MSDNTPTINTEDTQPEQEQASQEQPATNEQDAQDTTQQAEDDKTAKRISQLNEENAKWRTKFRDAETKIGETAEQLDAFKKQVAKMVGLSEEEEQSPEEIQAKYEQRLADSEARYQKLVQKMALTEAVAKAGADPVLTVPFIKGSDALASLDPGSDDYAAQVEALVQETVQANPKLRAQAAAASSGNAPTPTNNAEASRVTREDLADMPAEEISRLMREGKLKHLYEK